MPALRTFRLYSTFLFCMTFSHALLANTSPAFTVDEDQPLNGTLALSGAQGPFVINVEPYVLGDTTKSPRYQTFSLESNGTFTLQPESNWNGTLVFEWSASDSNYLNVDGNATITVWN